MLFCLEKQRQGGLYIRKRLLALVLGYLKLPLSKSQSRIRQRKRHRYVYAYPAHFKLMCEMRLAVYAYIAWSLRCLFRLLGNARATNSGMGSNVGSRFLFMILYAIRSLWRIVINLGLSIVLQSCTSLISPLWPSPPKLHTTHTTHISHKTHPSLSTPIHPYLSHISPKTPPASNRRGVLQRSTALCSRGSTTPGPSVMIWLWTL